jgi:CRISPR/Cas system CMR-associated protein Cmr5 small subunit
MMLYSMRQVHCTKLCSMLLQQGVAVISIFHLSKAYGEIDAVQHAAGMEGHDAEGKRMQHAAAAVSTQVGLCRASDRQCPLLASAASRAVG